VRARILLVLVAGLALAACGRGGGGGAPVEAGSTAGGSAVGSVGGSAPPPGIDLAAFAGDPVDEAELGLVTLGYGRAGRSGEVSYWQNRGTGSCAAVVVSDGRVTQARPAPRSAC